MGKLFRVRREQTISFIRCIARSLSAYLAHYQLKINIHLLTMSSSESPTDPSGAMPSYISFPPPSNPFTQPITLLLPDGTPFNVTMDQFAWFHMYSAQLSISRGVSLGASLVLLIVLLLLTHSDKRRSPIFALNVMALLINAMRSLLSCIYMASEWQNPYAVIAGDFDQVTSVDKSNSVAVPVLTLLLLMAVMTSLLLQVKVVLATVRDIYKWAILTVLGSMALVTIGFEFAVVVINSKLIVAEQGGLDPKFQDLLLDTYLVMMISFAMFMLVFLGKLGYAILQRRKIGVRQFGPMQILFIMMLQTLVVPSKLNWL
jgi:pheromone alpha factor receptor